METNKKIKNKIDNQRNGNKERKDKKTQKFSVKLFFFVQITIIICVANQITIQILVVVVVVEVFGVDNDN